MKPSTSLGTRSNVGIAKPSPAVRQTGNMRCLLVMGGVYRSSVLSGGTQVKYRCRCRVILTYVKTYALQVVQGRLFGMVQGKANQWIHVLLPALLAALRALGDAPA